MRVETNESLVRRNRRIAQYLTLFSFGALIAALFINFQPVFNPETVENVLILLLPSLILPIGLVTMLIAVRYTNLWVREPRPEKALREGLKGLSNKSVLYNYYHSPAQHVLFSPQGVYAIVVRYQDGVYTVRGDRWQTHGGLFSAFTRLLRRDGIGDPNFDAQRAAAHVKRLLQPIAPDVEVHPLIVFIDPRVSLTIEDPTIPVLFTNPKMEPNLKDYMRHAGRSENSPLTPQQIEAFEEATLPA